MIDSLADAWGWYESAQTLTLAMDRLGKKYWAALPWDGDLGKDNRLQLLEASEVLDRSKAVLDDLNDLCVLLLFSVFEATVRDRALADVAAELPPPRHPALQYAIKTLNDGLEHGSFYRVLEAYKGWDADLIEEVNQVRQYRNWVAHGRRGAPANAVDPRTAYDRLQRFLDQFNAAPVGPAGTGPLPM